MTRTDATDFREIEKIRKRQRKLLQIGAPWVEGVSHYLRGSLGLQVEDEALLLSRNYSMDGIIMRFR